MRPATCASILAEFNWSLRGAQDAVRQHSLLFSPAHLLARAKTTRLRPSDMVGWKSHTEPGADEEYDTCGVLNVDGVKILRAMQAEANAVRAAEGVHLRNLGRQAVTGRVATSADVTNAWANAGVIDLT